MVCGRRDMDARTQTEGAGGPSKAGRDGTWALQGIRAAVGFWLCISPFLLGHMETAIGWNELGIGLAVLVLTALIPVKPRARFLQIPLAIWLGMVPFVLDDGGELMSYFLNQLMCAKLLLIGAITTPDMFD